MLLLLLVLVFRLIPVEASAAAASLRRNCRPCNGMPERPIKRTMGGLLAQQIIITI